MYDDAGSHIDLWPSYRFDSLPFVGDRVRTKLQLNVRDVTEDGSLLPIAANPLGDATTWRIVDPRQFFLSATFDFWGSLGFSLCLQPPSPRGGGGFCSRTRRLKGLSLPLHSELQSARPSGCF